MESSNEIARDIRELEGLAKERIWIEGKIMQMSRSRVATDKRTPPQKGLGPCLCSVNPPYSCSTSISHLYKNRKQ